MNNSELVNILFKNKIYYKDSNNFGDFVLDTNIMNSITISRIINKDIALNELKIIKNVFSKFNIIFFLTHGICLGTIREKDFIYYDSDIDIGCYKKDLKTIILATQELEKKYKFKITKLSLNDNSISLIKNNVIIDISLYKLDNANWKSNKNKIFEIPFKYLNTLDEIDFLGLRINVPHDAENYLEYQYDKDWRMPIKDFHCPYRQKIEVPITNTLKHIMGLKTASFIAKTISDIIKKLINR